MDWELCDKCFLPMDSSIGCLSCNRSYGDKATEVLGPVSWEEVVEHLKSRLFMDTEWIVEAEDELWWYPSDLPVRIYVRDEGTFHNSPDNWMLITSEIEFATFEHEEAVQLAAELNQEFNLGVFVSDDGLLRLQSTLALNPLCRGLLGLFHEQVLAQVTFAKALAANLQSEGKEVLFRDHPISGRRVDVDELLEIYEGDYGLPILNGFEEHVEHVRKGLLNDLMLRDKYSIGYTADDVITYETPRTWLGLGVVNYLPQFIKHGPGLLLRVMAADRRLPLDPHAANTFNLIIGEELPCSQFGPIRVCSDPEAPNQTSSISVQLPYGWLAGMRLDEIDFAVGIKNAVMHSSSSMILVLDFFDSLKA